MKYEVKMPIISGCLIFRIEANNVEEAKELVLAGKGSFVCSASVELSRDKNDMEVVE